mgnify:CR=1 FL=1
MNIECNYNGKKLTTLYDYPQGTKYLLTARKLLLVYNGIGYYTMVTETFPLLIGELDEKYYIAHEGLNFIRLL